LIPTHTKKNGGETNISAEQLGKLSKQLNRPSVKIVSFVKKEAAAATTVKSDIMIIKKLLSADDLDDIIEKFIELNVLCVTCGNPETDEDPKRGRKCRACGSITKA
jgi:translation initiation factor 2 beta subunit (eIF-2beta)/eIF-5